MYIHHHTYYVKRRLEITDGSRPALHAAGKAKGELGFGAQWAGQGAPLSRPMSAGDLVGVLREELRVAGGEGSLLRPS